MPKNEVKSTASQIRNLNKPAAEPLRYDVRGKSISELQRITPAQWKSLNRRERSQVVSRLASAANKRLARFEKAGISTPASRGAMKRGKFSVKGKSKTELTTEYKRVKAFLSAETGTAKGYKKFKKRIKKSLKDTLQKKPSSVQKQAPAPKKAGTEGKKAQKSGDEEWTDADIEDFSDFAEQLYDEMRDNFPYIEDRKIKYMIEYTVDKSEKLGMSKKQVRAQAAGYLEKVNAKNMEEMLTDTSGYFDIGEGGGLIGE